MDKDAILRVIDSWPVEERIQFVQDVWDRIAESGTQPELTETQRAELQRRMADLDANPDSALSWEEIKEYLRRPR